ncbi:Fe-S cluster assembly protein SufD [Alienimonas sp. DA493]|uniref:Fe-S cluster assembly protein SufD n=1 Tax=Alienimonas sp. DA493 TaxID=3373605 RepID=UPI003753EC5B
MKSALTAAPAPATFDADAFERFLETRTEPAWVTERRREAFAEYLAHLAKPDPAEEYRRVELRFLRPEKFSLAESGANPAEFAGGMTDAAGFGGRAVHADGAAAHVELSEELKEAGVVFGCLSDLVNTHGELLEPYLMTKGVSPEADRFAAWHGAFWTGGTVLYVPRNVSLEQPLHSLIGLSGTGNCDLSHTLVILEDGADAALLEETASLGEDAGLHVGAVELFVGDGAKLRYAQLQNWNANTLHFAHQCGRVGRDGLLQWTVGGLGAKLAHVHQDVKLDGRGARGEVNGVTFSTGRQNLSYYTQQAHNAPDTDSDLLYKTVLRDKSKVVWRGMIKVEEVAQRTDGYQRCDSLMLSEDARSDSIPGLEIEADDVRCTHGATTGRVDEEQLFYCRSRGLMESEAMHMIVAGFFDKVLDRVNVDPVRQALAAATERKLGIGD